MEEDEHGNEGFFPLVWNSGFFWNPECPVAGHTDEVNSVDFSPDGKQFVSGSVDSQVKIWDTKTGAEVSRFWGLR